jgi:hypothetical protein
LETPFLIKAKEQLALDYNCSPECFNGGGVTVTRSAHKAGRRLFSDTPFFLNIASFGSGTVISAAGKVMPFALRIAEQKGSELLSTPDISELYGLAAKENRMVFQTIYYLPQKEILDIPQLPESDGFSVRIIEGEDIRKLYPFGFDNAFCKKEGERRDTLAAIILSPEGKIVSAAGASSDSNVFWQIGIDTLPEYRKKNLAKVLTTVLSNEIACTGRIPYYSAVPQNIPSHRTALSSGFMPAWVEYSVR